MHEQQQRSERHGVPQVRKNTPGAVMGTTWVLILLFAVAAWSVGVAVWDIVRDVRGRS